MPAQRSPWRWVEVSLIAVIALFFVCVAIRSRQAAPQVPAPAVTPSALAALDHLPAPLPPPREGAAMAFDARRGEVVLFGGRGDAAPGVTSLTDTWILGGGRWKQPHPRLQPPPMGDESMAYDAATERSVLVGVPDSGSPSAQTWLWDGATWARSSDVPFDGIEILQGIAADPTTGHPLLVTAVTAPGQAVLHTWTWDGTVWSLQLRAEPFPQMMTRPALASITRSTPAGTGPGVLMIFGTSSGSETWFWDGVKWSKEAEGRTPPYDPLNGTMAGDPTDGTVVLIGLPGGNGGSSTWVWDGGVWNEPARGPNVDSLYGATSALSDTRSGHVVVVGDQPNQLDLVWTWVGQAWVTNRGV
jgi:hypothetical protein